VSTINPIPLPYGDPIARARQPFKGNTLREVVDYLRLERQGFLTERWLEYLTQQAADQASASTRVNSLELKDKSASLGATDFSGGDLDAGLYEVLAYATIITPAGVSSSLTVTLDWTDRSASKSASGVTTGNTTGTVLQVGGLIRVDSASPVRYSTTYVSNPAAAMVYDLLVVLRRVAA
jgi:hypothetical protein